MDTYFIECKIDEFNEYKDRFVFERDGGSFSKYKYTQNKYN